MADKDVAGRRSRRSPRRRSPGAARVICTQVDLPRALPAASAGQGLGGGRARLAVRSSCRRSRRPLERALAEAPGPIVVAGSLYLVGAVRAILVDDPELRDEPAAAAAYPRAPGPRRWSAVR